MIIQNEIMLIGKLKFLLALFDSILNNQACDKEMFDVSLLYIRKYSHLRITVIEFIALTLSITHMTIAPTSLNILKTTCSNRKCITHYTELE